ncbi:hypothetical protein ACFWM5_40095 [Streptomyces bobili]|uniref:hypothetical protein n=1 Tax=Streptomyces bobili TaxID=67280 RepID=UPI0036531420
MNLRVATGERPTRRRFLILWAGSWAAAALWPFLMGDRITSSVLGGGSGGMAILGLQMAFLLVISRRFDRDSADRQDRRGDWAERG